MNVSSDSQERQTLSIIDVDTIKGLIQVNTFSLLLCRYGDKLLLLITGLNIEKKDYPQIRIAIVGESDDGTERILRGIVVEALQNTETLRNLVNQYVDNESSRGGFRAALSLKDAFYAFKVRVKSQNAVDSDKHRQYGNTVENRATVAAELKDHKLPLRQGVLIVVTKNVSSQNLKQQDIWLSLSEELK